MILHDLLMFQFMTKVDFGQNDYQVSGSTKSKSYVEDEEETNSVDIKNCVWGQKVIRVGSQTS